MLSVLEVFTIFDLDYEGKSFDEASTQENRVLSMFTANSDISSCESFSLAGGEGNCCADFDARHRGCWLDYGTYGKLDYREFNT